MSKLIQFPNRARIREEASQWCIRLGDGLAEGDRQALEAWLAADAAHRREFVELARLWDEMSILSVLSEVFPLDPESVAPGRRRRMLPLAAAAAVVLAVATGWLVLAGVPWHGDAAAETLHAYETAVGVQSTVQLADGSSLTLNTNSLAEVRYTAGERTVELRRGEAYFDITSDPERPFSVYAGGRRIQAIGTAFNVYLKKTKEVEVTVVEGAVRVATLPPPSAHGAVRAPVPRRTGETRLVGGDRALLGADHDRLQRIQPAQLEVQLAWKQGMIVFDGEPLERVLQEVARYTTMEFRYEDEAVRHVRVGGYFRAGDVDGLVATLERNFDITARRMDDSLIALSTR